MRRPHQHVMEDASYALLESLLPPDWIVRRLPKDYGVDLEIELVDAGVVTGNRIWVQMKSSKSVRHSVVTYDATDFSPSVGNQLGRVTAQYIPFRLSTPFLKYSLQCPFPLLLFVADLDNREVYFLPLRNEIEENVSSRTPAWRARRTSTVRVPINNALSSEAKRNFFGLRWFAMEPARMYALALLGEHYHELQYRARLSGYQIGDGWIDGGEERELRKSLEVARSYLVLALEMDVLFGERGIYPIGNPRDSNDISIGTWLLRGVDSAYSALNMLDDATFTLVTMGHELGIVHHATNLLSTAIAEYQDYRAKFLLTEQGTIIAALFGSMIAQNQDE